MTRTRQTARPSAAHAPAKNSLNDKPQVVPVKKPRKKANTPFSFARERIKLCSQTKVFWKIPFRRLVNEITVELYGSEPESRFRWQTSAVDAIQETAEEYLLELFEDANTFANHSGRPTLLPKDLRAALYLYDKHRNKEMRPKTIHEKEVEKHAEKLQIKKERRSVTVKKEEHVSDIPVTESVVDDTAIVVKLPPKTPRKPRTTKNASSPVLAPASDEVDPNNL